ncbi:MAG TPA: DUF3822 family protein [Draconibacterium sp.]|nr:DUF3822 family protein [Draconibacterium sp.]
MFDIIKDESFDIENTKQYILSIQVCLDGFSFLIIHPSENKIVAFKSNPLKISSENLLLRRLKEWLESEALLKNSFKIVRVFIFAESFTLVPEELSEIDLFENLTSVLFPNDSNSNLVKNKITNLNAQLIFPVPNDLSDVLHHNFIHQVEIIHPVTKFLQSPIESKSRNSAVIISSGKFFYLIIYRNKNLLLANSFQAAHSSDLVYNVLNAFQQLEIARIETDLYITDAFIHNTKLEDTLKPYFNNINILKTEGLISYSEIADQSLLLYLTII